jgi:hypothetical protein
MRSPAKLLAIAAAGGALAIGVPAAIAATGSDETTPSAITTEPVQQQEQAAPQDAPDGHDCPEKGGRGDGDGPGGQGSGGGNTAPDSGAQGTTTPAPTTTPDV